MKSQMSFVEIAEAPVQCEADENPKDPPEAILGICFAF